MKSSKLSFDFSDVSELVEMLRIEAVKEKTTQKALVVKALRAYFADKFESKMLLSAAEKTFHEWGSEEDKVYDTL